MTLRDRFRLLAQLNRTHPEPVGGGYIGGPPDRPGSSTPYLLSHGYAIVHGHTVGVDHDGPVVVQGDDWAPLSREDRPEWMTEASWDRIAGQDRPRCYVPAPGFTVGFGHPAPVSCILADNHDGKHRAANGAEW